jgi:hypothetical protein
MAASATTLGIDGAQFTLDGTPTFLVGISYYGGLGASKEFVAKDFDDLKLHGLNWVRVWATWGAHDSNVSAVDTAGNGREPYLGALKGLVEQADKRGMVVDVTLSRGNGAVSDNALLRTQEAHLQAVATLARELKPYRNVYLDVGNERNVRDPRFVSHEEIKALRDRIKEIDPDRLVTASHAGGELSREELAAYLLKSQVDFLAPHRPRNAASPGQTAEKTQECFRWMREAGRVIPIHYQEPFRRDYSPWQPKALDFLVDARQARDGGAAGWCLHNGSPKSGQPGKRRSFDMRAEQGRLFDQLDTEERQVADQVSLVVNATTKTWLGLFDSRWHLNGQVTYPGAKAEGLLMNVRMVNSVFEDANDKTRPKGFDPDANTAAFIAQIPDYVAHGIRAFTIFLQGGMPGYEGAVNSAFTPAGELRPEYLTRVERVIRAADDAGAAVILGCYYQRQDQLLRDADAVRTGVVNTARWVRDNGFADVALEIANEYAHGGFDHPILRTPAGIAELMRLAKATVPGLLVSASGLGHGKSDKEVCEAADFLLVHFNSTPLEQIPARVEALKGYGKAIVCNEDDKDSANSARAAEASVACGCSWGLMLSGVNQYVPFEFKGAADDPVVYGKLRELTTPR